MEDKKFENMGASTANKQSNQSMEGSELKKESSIRDRLPFGTGKPVSEQNAENSLAFMRTELSEEEKQQLEDLL